MEITIKIAGVRLDKALADNSELSRSQANEEIKKGIVLVNGQVKKRNILFKKEIGLLLIFLKRKY